MQVDKKLELCFKEKVVNTKRKIDKFSYEIKRTVVHLNMYLRLLEIEFLL